MFKAIVSLSLLFVPLSTLADWHGGKIRQINVGHDGKTVTVRIDNWSRNDCSCYSYWPDMMCLDYSRDTLDFEKSLILSAKAKNSEVFFYIDERTCLVEAIYEAQ
ncbi:hypothetical protein [Vibrio bivalvicida]|uniref:Uncharacterized protein n=1 Tax=Vibrio bivalvicida TaxID=1276888 RepID=A0ABV4MHU4_9VIBR